MRITITNASSGRRYAGRIEPVEPTCRYATPEDYVKAAQRRGTAMMTQIQYLVNRFGFEISVAKAFILRQGDR